MELTNPSHKEWWRSLWIASDAAWVDLHQQFNEEDDAFSDEVENSRGDVDA